MDVGTDVWVKSDDAVWAPGVVLDCQEMHVTGVVKVKVASGEIVTRRYLGDGDDLNEIFLRNKRRDFSTLACLIVLEYLHEPALLHALSERFAHDRIYTSIGDILLAVNPFKDLDLYTDAVIQQYKAAMLSTVSGTAALDAPDACPPHVFAIAGKAFSGLLRPDAKNQSILVSGESGSGKTESTKFLMKFLTSVGHDFSAAAMAATSQPPRSTSSDSDIAPAGDIMEIGKRILQTNPILESFGNARTIRNDNSSRFGKFIKIQFDAQNQIVGAEIASYLLEKVRLIHQSPQERNFHIFYELLEGADNDLLATLGLERGAKYELLNAYGTATPGSGGSGRGMSLLAKRKSPLAAQYSKRYAQTVQAFTDTGVEEIERTLIFQILGALLHLGNLNFEQVSSAGAPEEAAAVTETSMFHLEKCAELLGVSVEKLTSLLLTREITAGSDIVKLKLNAEQSKDASRSFAKAIYGRLFTWLVRRLSDGINYREYLTALEQNEIKTIGILDIFGFESLEENGFEQLCINYANERLQAQFNEFVFIKEQDIYVSQGIDWRSISYPSNAACLALFDEKVNGLFSLLDQECMMPKGSDQALSTKYYRSHGGPDITESLLQPQLSQRYTLPLLVTSFGRYLQHSTSSTVSDKDDDDKTRPFTASKMDRVNKQFVIKHFAGKVTYRVDQFLEKNQDSLPTDACLLLTTSENDIVSMIGAEEGVEDAPESNGRGRARSKSRSSLLRAPSVSFQFRGQLDLLIDEIGHTEAHYIRCLKPNEDKKPRAFDRHRMVEQLRSVGVLEALRIARAGYSARLSHETFVDSFSCYRYKLEKAGQQMPTELPDLCKALLAALLDEVNAEKKDGAPPVKTLLKVDNAKFNEMVRGYGVQFGSSIVFCKTNAYNAFIRLRLRVRDQAARVLQRYGRGFLHRHRFLKQRRAARIIQTRVRRHQAMQFFSRIRQLRRRRAAHCIERYLQLALANKRVVDAKIRHHQLKRAFANFQLGCKLKSQEVDELLAQARHIEEEQASNFVEDEDTFSDDRHQAEKYMRPPSSQGKGIARNVRSTENIERQRSSRRVRSSSDEPEVEQGEDQSLRHEIERLKKLLGQQKSQPPALQRKPSSRSGRSRVGSLDVSSARRYRSRRSMSIEKSDGVSEADDELDDSEEHAPPRRAQSVKLARDADHVTKLTKRIEELDAKCRQLERLVSRPPGPYDYPPSRSGSSRRRNSIANSDGSNGGYPDYPYENQSNGGGSSSGVENLIWSIQQQMDALRQSVAAKVDDDSAAIQARHDAHAMSFASSQPTRSSTITSNGSSTNQPFDGPLPEDAEMNGYPSLPSPSRTNSDPHLGYRGYGYQTPPTPASEASFRMGGVPRHPNSANGYPFPAAPPVVKWSRSTHCHECNDPFTLFVRRHHCRMCGNSFCHEHSSRRVALLGMGFDDEPQRVCDACFADYQAHASSSPDYFPPMPTPTSMRGAAGPPAHFGQPMYRQRSFSQQYYPPPPQHAQSYHHLQVPRTPQRYQQQPYYGGWAPPPPAAPSSHTSAA